MDLLQILKEFKELVQLNEIKSILNSLKNENLKTIKSKFIFGISSTIISFLE